MQDFLALSKKAKTICIFLDFNAYSMSSLNIPVAMWCMCDGITDTYSSVKHPIYTFHRRGETNIDVMEPCQKVSVQKEDTHKGRLKYVLHFSRFKIVAFFDGAELL